MLQQTDTCRMTSQLRSMPNIIKYGSSGIINTYNTFTIITSSKQFLHFEM